MLILTGFISLLIVAWILLALGQWTVGVVKGIRLARQSMLQRSWISVLVRYGWTATGIALFGPSFALYLADLLSGQHPNTLFVFGTIFALPIALCFCFLLWIATLYLRLQPKQPSYFYLLPGDADEVRREGCQRGVFMMALLYPNVPVDTSWIDAFVRALQVETRMHVFPRGKKDEWQLTNDFSVYCNLVVEGFERGYQGFLALCNADPEYLEAQRAFLQQWPENRDAGTLLKKLAEQIMHRDDGEK